MLEEQERARALVLRYGWNAMAYQILNPGMAYWFGDGGESVVGFARAGRWRVVAGAPICSPASLAETALAFIEDARRAGQRVCFFGAQERLEQSLAGAMPLARLMLGAQPVWRPERWIATVHGKPSLRAQLARARNKGVTVSLWPSSTAAGHPALLRCLDEWLETRGLPPMHFLVEPNTLALLVDRRVYVAERSGAAIGFLVASPVPLRQGWLVEQIIRGAAAPNGTAELLLDAAMRDLAARDSAYVTLGLAPLARRGHAPGPREPLWVRLLLAWVRAHGRRFYHFDGLESFKAKFAPEHWEPIFAVSDQRRITPAMLYAVAGAFSGAPPPLFIGGALLRALRQELRWARRRAAGAGR